MGEVSIETWDQICECIDHTESQNYWELTGIEHRRQLRRMEMDRSPARLFEEAFNDTTDWYLRDQTWLSRIDHKGYRR